MKPSRWLVAIGGIVISAVFLYAAFRDLKPDEVWASVQGANIFLVALGAVWYFAAVVFISVRWQFLLRAVKAVSVRDLVPLVCICYAGNNIYPFRSGEILRILLLQRHNGVPVARATTVVVIERVFDGLIMLSFILVPLMFIDVPSPEVRAVASVATPIFLAALAVFLVLAAQPKLLRGVILFVSRLLPERLGGFLRNTGEDILSGLQGLRSPGSLLGAVAMTYLSWGIEASVYWIVSKAFNLETTYPMMLLTMGVVNLAGLIPASPGLFGIFEFFVAAVLVSLGMPSVTVHAFALVLHMVIWLPVTLLGLYLLFKQGLGLGAISNTQKLEQPSTA